MTKGSGKMQQIKLQFQDQTLVINPLGGGIMEYYTGQGDDRIDIIYGYNQGENKVGSMGDVLFPFPGRVENSKYTFEGQEYELKNVKLKDGHAIHGFVKTQEWQIEKQDPASVELSITLKKGQYQENGFPFSLKITLAYSLSKEGMTCQAKVENIGGEKAPFGLGFHPYFSVGTDQIDEMILQIKADKLVEFDAGLKPTGKLLEVSGSDLDFNQPKRIDARVVDNCYTELKLQAHLAGVKAHPRGGLAETVISDGRGRTVIIWQDESFPYLQVYSADTIGDNHRRRGFAIEPQTCTGFAFNVERMGLKTLEPGEVFEGSWGASPKLT
jgi:aldose 1-epimerase